MPVRRYAVEDGRWCEDNRATSVEQVLKVELNGELVTECLCSPGNQLDLAVGALAQRGLLQSRCDLAGGVVRQGLARVETTALCQRRAAHRQEDPRYYDLSQLRAFAGTVSQPPEPKVQAANALQVANKLLGELAATHERTNGVHSGVLYDPVADKILVFREDIGRHNVFDKLYGWAIRHEVEMAGKMIVFSGRCSTEMMLKLWRMGCRLVLAKSVPTTLSVELAEKLGITLMARLTRDGFSVYTHAERVH